MTDTRRPPRRARRTWRTALAVVVGLVAAASPAAAQEATAFTISFTGLLPGVPQTRTATVTIDESGWVRELVWVERTGIMVDATVTVRVCDRDGLCADAIDPAGSPRLAAGAVTVQVTTTLPSDADPDATGTAVGRLTFANDDPSPPGVTPTTVPGSGGVRPGRPGGGGSAATGADALTVTLWASATFTLGATLVAFARHRRSQQAPA